MTQYSSSVVRYRTKAALGAIDEWLKEEIVGFEPEEG
jgi:hypothetical protein